MILSLRAARSIGLYLILLAVCLVSASTAKAAPAAPAWSITATSQPTNFAPNSVFDGTSGPFYYIVATNVGAAGVTGNFTVVDQLPPGITPSPAKAPSGTYGSGHLTTPFDLSCSAVAETVTCTGGPGHVRPGELVVIEIPVKLSAGVEGEVTNTATISGGGATAPATVQTNTRIESELAPFGLMSDSNAPHAWAVGEDGSAASQAGTHPYRFSIGLTFPTVPPEAGQQGLFGAGGGVRDIAAVLPPGLTVNPAAAVKCKEQELTTGATGCPTAAQVGTVQTQVSISTLGADQRPLYNMVAPPGSPGVFAFEVLEGVYVHLIGRLNSEGRYELAASANDILAKAGVAGAETVLWGNPTAESHDAQRGACLFEGSDPERTCPTQRKNVAFVTLPSTCSPSLPFFASADSWQSPGVFDQRVFALSGVDGNPIAVGGCSGLSFEPSIQLQPDETRADSPTGLSVALHVPQRGEYEDQAGNVLTAPSTLRDAKVTLPPGVSVNPASANGRTACTAAQIGLKTPVGQADARFFETRETCPDASKIGSVEVESPLLKDEPVPGVQAPHVLPGSIYLAQPYENPFNSLLAIYISIFDPQTGVVVKLPGEVQANSVSGQLTATFRDNPQLPFENFRLQFYGGPRGTLRTPSTCASYSTRSDFTPWSGGPAVTGFDRFSVTQSAGGGGCPTSLSQRPHQPSFDAGTSSPLAASYSPFVLKLTRDDGSQELGGLNVTLPVGLTGKLAGTPYCPESALAGAASKRGRDEQAHPSCPSASEVGTVTVGAGAGPLPLYVEGKAYLAGPYRGEPLSLAIVTPAVAGPYDLGTVVVRSALHVNPFNAQISVHSDPLPTILQGIPLDIRSVTVQMSKPNFTLNPTSCEPMSITGEAISTSGQVAQLSSRFQAAGCKNLGFKPKLKLTLKGATKRSGHPALKAVVTYPKGGSYANIARAQVGLPHSEFLDQGNLDKVCKQADLRAGTCPKTSIYGRAKAWTPLLDKPLQGPVYLGVGFGYKLPALVADLNGQVRILLKGKTDTTKHDGLRNTFEAVPDAPVSRFVLELKGGKKYGLLENSENICRKTQRASAMFNAQNGMRLHMRPKIHNSCRKKKHRKHSAHGKGRNGGKRSSGGHKKGAGRR